MTQQVKLMLDSGAYSAWKRKNPIQLREYLKFIRRYSDCIHSVVNLDVIPGEWGRIPSSKEVEESAKQGWKNLLFLRNHGVEAMAVFHQGERRYWLEKMIGEGFDYIGISCANDRSPKEKRDWFDEIFTYLCDGGGFPMIKTHAFGMTAGPNISRYPWYSADSTSWMLSGAYGIVLVPKIDSNGKYDFMSSPLPVIMSTRENKELSNGDIQHSRNFRTMGHVKRKYVVDYLSSIGFNSIEELQTIYYKRQHANCVFFKLLEAQTQRKPFALPVGLFDGVSEETCGIGKDLYDPFSIIYVISTCGVHSDCLQEEERQNRLITYYYFRNSDPFDLAEYVRTGLIPKSEKKRKKKRIRKRLA